MCLRESCMRENRTCSLGGGRRSARKRASSDPTGELMPVSIDVLRRRPSLWRRVFGIGLVIAGRSLCAVASCCRLHRPSRLGSRRQLWYEICFTLCRLPRLTPDNRLRKIPLMSLWIRCAIPALPVPPKELVFGRLQDRCARSHCLREMLVHTIDMDKQALRRLPQSPRVLVLGSGVAHHHYSIGESHGCMAHFALVIHRPSVTAHSEGFSQERHRSGNIFVVEIRGDGLRSAHF